MNKTTELLKDLYKKNKLSHAILIETNNQNFCLDEILELTKFLSCENIDEINHENCTLCNMIEKKESINLFIIEPDGKNIKKEQMLELQKKCSKTPIISKNNVYIIVGSENFNKSSANTMLKFIEEPFNNCYGFLIINSKENMIDTIKSRCEIYTMTFKEVNIMDKYNLTKEEYQLINEDLFIYLEKLYENSDIIINKEILKDVYKKKECAQQFFGIMLDLYENEISIIINKVDNNKYGHYNFIKNEKLSILIKKKAIIINILNNMMYNLNMDLLYDKFVIEMGDINE